MVVRVAGEQGRGPVELLEEDQARESVREGQAGQREQAIGAGAVGRAEACLLYTSPSPRDRTRYRMPSSA